MRVFYLCSTVPGTCSHASSSSGIQREEEVEDVLIEKKRRFIKLRVLLSQIRFIFRKIYEGQKDGWVFESKFFVKFLRF